MEKESLNAAFLEANIGGIGSNLQKDACSTVPFALELTIDGSG